MINETSGDIDSECTEWQGVLIKNITVKINSNVCRITLAQYDDCGVDDTVRLLEPVSSFGKYRCGDNTVG